MTAIAAVIALSSTPLFAQAADASADPAVPVAVTPPPVAAVPPDVSTVAPVDASAPAMKMVGTPVIHEADSSATSTTPAITPTRAAPVPVKRVATAPAARMAAPVAAASVNPIKADVAPAPLPAPAVAGKVAVAPPAAAPAAAPPAATDRTATVSTTRDETLPIAGGVGLAVIALGGVAYAASRRRRHDRDALPAEPGLEAAPVAATRPLMPTREVAATPLVAAPAAGAAARTLPSGFDISRFGRYTQAAYLGPTPDNPSHSLKRRLKRASFFDQREREAVAAGRVEQPAAVTAARAASQEDGQVTVRLAPQRKTGVFGYVLQR